MGNIVLVGAGGTGMSGIAGLLHDLGYINLVCIDGFQGELTDKLEKKGIKMIIGHDIYKPKLDDLVIYSEAVADSAEVTQARELAKEHKKITLIMNYFQFLGEISKYFITVGFAGTNGKSSTTAMAITTAKETISNLGIGILGALVPQLHNQSYYLNTDHKDSIKGIFDFILTGKPSKTHGNHDIKSLFFFVEACEYKRHFLYLDLDYAIITSLELDHTDYYKDMDDYMDAFYSLANKTKQKILIPKNLEFTPTTADTKQKIIKIPIEKLHFKKVRGEHNNINGSLVISLLKILEPAKTHESEIVNFQGLRRRMELLRENKKGAKIYSDYGHMASSIMLGYHALKEKYPDKKLLVIFQPHQINRILLGRNDFIQALKPYNEIIIYDIYAARENLQELLRKSKQESGSIKTLDDLGENFAKACGGRYITDIQDIKYKIENTDNNTIIIIFSAGDIDYKLRAKD